ncbi:hypothetical protein [Duncaniella muris]|jgi:hypothetical protein|nr:hypothetical protein [Duncaniella muris]GFI53379.1 hypothetical protein IMSAGC021_01696 [Muribaculaceae bacterium]
MTNMLKVLRADVNNIFRSLGSSDSFRVTGDCTIRINEETK